MASIALERRAATWEEYQALGEDVRAEYIDGAIVVSPFPSRVHQNAAFRLTALLTGGLPEGYGAIGSWGWKPGADEFGPDVMVYPLAEATSDLRFTGTPVLCVEIVSGNRSNDYVTKTHKYAVAGLDHYWILDPRDAQLDVLVRESEHYRLETQLFAGSVAEVSFGIATVTVDLEALLDGAGPQR